MNNKIYFKCKQQQNHVKKNVTSILNKNILLLKKKNNKIIYLALWSKVTVLIPIHETQPYPNKYTYKIWQDVSTEGRHLETRDPRDTCNLSRWILTSSLVFGTHHFLQTITKVALVGLDDFFVGTCQNSILQLTRILPPQLPLRRHIEIWRTVGPDR